MNIPHALSRIIRHSKSFTQILDKTVEIVAKELELEVCSIYLLDPSENILRLAATHGLDKAALKSVVLSLGEGITGTVVKEMRAISVEDAPQDHRYRHFPESKEEQFHAYLGVPMAIRNRPVGALVVQSKQVRKFSENEEFTLHTICAQLVGVVENARLIHALDRPESAKVYLEEVIQWNRKSLARVPQDTSHGELTLSGNAASPGLVFGKTVFRGAYDLSFEGKSIESLGYEQEAQHLENALELTRDDILTIQEAASDATDEENALIFSSHLMLLNDPFLLEKIDLRMQQNQPAAYAVDEVFTEVGQQLEKVRDSYLQERVEDIRDLRSRILWHLLEPEGVHENLSNQIVIAHGLPPSLVVEMKVQGALGLITERGGLTSHGALLARSLGIPAVTGVENIVYMLQPGDSAILDGNRGKVILRPDRKSLAKHRSRAERLTTTRIHLQKLCHEPAESLDGVQVKLLANIGLSADVKQAHHYGAEGIGLYRTEYPFLIREEFPTREQQTRIYRRAFKTFPDQPVLFRILDLGGDKFHPLVSSPTEANPALGYRSLRMILDQPDLLKEQLIAFVEAAEGKTTQILVPMVSSIEEFLKVREILNEALNSQPHLLSTEVKLGAMIENPAAVEIAQDLAEFADFFSIGSNDLIQFTLAVDRENARVASSADPFHPAILRMIHRTIQAAHSRNREVGVCGQHASIPSMALLLIAMGVDSLSLIPNAIPEVKEAIRQARINDIVQELPAILNLSTTEETREKIQSLMPELEEEIEE